MITSKLKTLFYLLGDVSPEERPNLAILTETEFLFSYKNRLSHSEFVPEAGPTSGLKPERGSVMDFFAQLELIANQILLVHLAGTGGDIERHEDILDYIGFFAKIRLLDDWGLVNRETRKQLHRLRTARNGFAHNWNIKEINYADKSIMESFGEFRTDATEAFKTLTQLYTGKNTNIDELIESLSVSNS